MQISTPSTHTPAPQAFLADKLKNLLQKYQVDDEDRKRQVENALLVLEARDNLSGSQHSTEFSRLKDMFSQFQSLVDELKENLDEA
ncbi:MAG: hypothetical protein AAF206_25805 [Bacteroidota bacterium]